MLLIVRHGQTEPNVHGQLLGRADPPLTDLGRTQARALAAALPEPDLLISSPLQRARDTAAAFGPTVDIDERWIELDYGDVEGQPGSTGGDLWARWLTDASFAPPGGESLDAVGTRVRDACDGLMERAAASTVIVVTHVSPVKAALAWALDVPDTIAWRMFVEDAGVARIDLDAGRPVVRWFNRGVRPAD